jgi:hypothetical protein
MSTLSSKQIKHTPEGSTRVKNMEVIKVIDGKHIEIQAPHNSGFFL